MSAAESIVPLVDLRAQYATLKSEVDAAVDGVLARGDFILGEEWSEPLKVDTERAMD